MPPPNHDSLPKGIPKIKSQASTAQNLETLQSQSRQGRKKRLSLNRLRVLYGRLIYRPLFLAKAFNGPFFGPHLSRDIFQAASEICCAAL
jgi:hypothetical protein